MPKRFRSLLIAWRNARRRRPAIDRRRTALESLEPRQLLAADLLISELMASNKATLLDADGQASDWIEIHNPIDQVVSLNGWSLTDDPNDLTKWAFPPLQLEPNAYLVTFASGKDRANDPYRVIRDFNATPDGTFLVDLPAGTYDVRLTLGDDSRPRDQVVVNLQGAMSIRSRPRPAGSSARHTRPRSLRRAVGNWRCVWRTWEARPAARRSMA